MGDDVGDPAGWRFFVDRGGTFTDVVAIAPDGARHVRKVLSDDASHDADAAVAAMRRLGAEIAPRAPIHTVRMGTTLATNALLERKGEPTCLAITKGFADALVIGTQQRPDLFALHVVKPPPLPQMVVEIEERVLPDGTVRQAPDVERVRVALRHALDAGCSSLAVVLVHGFAHPDHERVIAGIAREVGFAHVSTSHEVAAEIGLVPRGDTTTADAYLTPVLSRHVDRLLAEIGPGPEVRLMQSSGGLVAAAALRGKDALLSGPAGGVVALAHVAREAGLEQVIGLDMGGTSTDVGRWSACEGLERVHECAVAGVRVRAPMVDVVTVAAGGGSVLRATSRRLSVGPESAGARPGPACYGRGGPATVTDANVVLGRVQPTWFPRCFGPSGDAPIDPDASRARVAELAVTVGLSVEQAAAGFVKIANENMAAAIREVSVARGRDVREHALVCFGGAAPQHACQLAASLGIRRILLHPLAGVLSAYGMGLADVRRATTRPVLGALDDVNLAKLEPILRDCDAELRRCVEAEGVPAERVRCEWRLDLRHAGTEHALDVPLAPEGLRVEALREEHARRHARLYGFERPGDALEIVALRVEAIGSVDVAADPELPRATSSASPIATVKTWFERVVDGVHRLDALDTPVHERTSLRAGHHVDGPALVVEQTSTTVVDPGWSADVDARGVLVLEHREAAPHERASALGDPVSLEVFANRFMSIAEQMGETLRRVSRSTNIKERLDYSCAIFTDEGVLVANAPHVPVHLGAMGVTVRALLEARGREGMREGMVLASNDPFHGGSHLPDITVVTPVFHEGRLAFFVACRGHHADVGGRTPGSMPAFSRNIREEGVLLHDVALVEECRFRADEVRRLLAAPPHPVRDPEERVADLESQVAANAVGARLLRDLANEHGREVVAAMMRHVLDDAAEATREALRALPSATRRFEDALDDGSRIAVTVTIEGDRARFDFTGTSPQHAGNLNAPRAVTTAAVLYALRCLVGRSIPLNEGCLEPVEIVVPPGTHLSPEPPAAVAGGNVETSQRITDVVFGALGVLAASQGTMNNVTLGDDTFGYYETICGGTGAGATFDGASAVHSHMTNTRLTDVEVLERRCPVLVRELSIRRGSGGVGRHRGGDGVVRALEVTRPVRAAILSERRVHPPFGLEGGAAGACGRNTLVKLSGERLDLGGKCEIDLSTGDVLLIETPGGGGFGPRRS